MSKKIDVFLSSIGVLPEYVKSVNFIKRDKTYEVLLERPDSEFEEDFSAADVAKMVGKNLSGRMEFDIDGYGRVIWNISGLGVVSYDEETETLKVVSTPTEKDVAVFIVELVDVLDHDQRYKSYDIVEKTKTIHYQCYERCGVSSAKMDIKKMMNKFGLNGWKLEMEEPHWG